MSERRPYNDPHYRTARAWLTAHPDTPCWHQCGRKATTLDHIPPVAHHAHQRGTNCCTLKPACSTCQNRQGAAITNTRRASGYPW